MKVDSKKYLCLSLIMFSYAYGMDFPEKYYDMPKTTVLDNTVVGNGVIENYPQEQNSFTKLSDRYTHKYLNKDISNRTKKFIDSDISGIINSGDLDRAKDILVILEKKLSDIKFKDQDKTWINAKIIQLKAFIGINKSQVAKEIEVQTPEVTKGAEIVDLYIAYKKLEADSTNTSLKEESTEQDTQEAKDVEPDNIEFHFAEPVASELQEQLSKVTDLSKSIQDINELDIETKDKLEKLNAAQESLQKSNDSERLSAAKTLVSDLEKTEAQKVAAIRALEEQIKKLKDESKDNAESQKEVAELEGKLAKIKEGQKDAQAKINEAKNKCVII